MASKPRPRVFLDSNVIFSGLHSSHGPPGAILDQAIHGDFVLVVSRQVLEEIVRTIKAKLPEALPALSNLLMSVPLEVVADPPLEGLKPWHPALRAGDAGILAAAVAAQPDYFVTGDSHFLDRADAIRASGLLILTSAQFLKTLDLPRR